MVMVNVLVEGRADEPVAKRLLIYVGLEVGNVYGLSGKADLLRRLPNYNQAARFRPWFTLIDLDNDAICASQAIISWLPNCEIGMRLRVAVRSIESWLMADAERLARFLAISEARLPENSDIEENPKKTLVHLARTSRKKSIREDMVPRQGSGAKIGPLYVAKMTEFAEKYWRPDVAANHSESLRRCIAGLKTLTEWDNIGDTSIR